MGPFAGQSDAGSFSRQVVSDSSATPWAAAHQAPLSMGFPRQEHWSGLPSPSQWVGSLLPHLQTVQPNGQDIAPTPFIFKITFLL